MIGIHSINIGEDRPYSHQIMKTLEQALIIGSLLSDFYNEKIFFYIPCNFAYALAKVVMAKYGYYALCNLDYILKRGTSSYFL